MKRLFEAAKEDKKAIMQGTGLMALLFASLCCVGYLEGQKPDTDSKPSNKITAVSPSHYTP